MRVLILAPDLYTIDKTIAVGFVRNNIEVIKYDFRQEMSGVNKFLDNNRNKLPYKLKNIWKNNYYKNINNRQIEIYDKINPGIVYIYNNENLIPETIKYFKRKSKIVVFLGDNPFYSVSNEKNLELLFYADLIISPDSYWIEQLKMLGLKNLLFDTLCYNIEDKFIEEKLEDKQKYSSDIIFVGNTYANSWGYKRALFLSKFCDFKIKIYGHKTWEKWFDSFPVLKQKVILLDKRLNLTEVNKLYHYSKLFPVDAHPGIMNGIHIRFFDSVSSNLLPIIEYKKDYDEIIEKVNIPVIYKYDEISYIVRKYLANENLYNNTLNLLKDFVFSNYSPEKSIKKVLDYLILNS